MNCGLKKLIGGCFVGGAVFVGAVYFAANPEAEAAVSSDWSAIEINNLFLHDLTDQPAVFVAAMVVGPDGAVTGQAASLNTVKFGPAGSKVIAAKSSQSLAMETELDRSIVMNASEETVMAYFETSAGLREVRMLPGEGAAVGAMLDIPSNHYRWGCKCVCEHGDTEFEIAFMYCDELFEGYVSGSCDCLSLQGTPCWFEGEAGMIEGQMMGCKSGLVPRDTGGTGNGG